MTEATNVFDLRTLNNDEQQKLKKVIQEGAKEYLELQDRKEGLRDLIKEVADTLNEGIEDKALKIKPSLINAMIRVQVKSDLEQKKTKVAEIEDGLTSVGLS